MIIRHSCCSSCGWKGCYDELVHTKYKINTENFLERFKSDKFTNEELLKNYQIINGFAPGKGCPNCGITFYCKYIEIPRLENNESNSKTESAEE